MDSEILKYANSIPISLPKSNNYICVLPYEFLKKRIVIPEIQRDISEEWVNELYTMQMRHYEKYGFFDVGIIDVCILKEDEIDIHILNGQHRINVIDRIYTEKNCGIWVYCNVHWVENVEEMNMKWVVLNHSRPVKIYPTQAKNTCMNVVKKYLKRNYKKYISESDKHHRSNINLDKLEEEIQKSGVLMLEDMDSDKMIKCIENMNENILNMNVNCYYELLNTTDISIIYKTKQKNPMKPFLLGLYMNYEWVHMMKYMIEKNKYEEIKMPKIVTKRKVIPAKLRLLVWKKHNDENSTKGKCYVCEDKVTIHDFECAHVISTYFHGETVLDNLQVCCRACNNDMNIRNLEEYKKQYFPGKKN